MILADKIIRLRKRSGWSQEELAEKLDVSRQAVSKWESAQTVPNLEKILQMSELFGVTTDYLLKDEIEKEEFADDAPDSVIRCITMEEANAYLEQRRSASLRIALATFLCIVSPIALIVLVAASELEGAWISETTASIIGLIALFGCVTCAVSIFILCGFRNEPYDFLERSEPFELAYGVKGMVTERKKKFRDTYVKYNVSATCICIFSPIPLILAGFTDMDFLCVAMLSVMMLLVGIGVSMFIVVGVRNASMQKLLQEGEFSMREKKRNGIKETVGFAYWGILTAVFVAWTYLADSWQISWIVFVVGGVLFPVVMSICNSIADRK